MRILLALILAAAPLAAQDTIPLPGDFLIINGDSIFINVDVDVSTERIAEAFEALQASLDSATAALRDCDRCEDDEGASSGPGPVVVDVGKSIAFVVLAIFGLQKLGQIVDALEKGHEPTQEETKDPPDEEHGEGGGET